MRNLVVCVLVGFIVSFKEMEMDLQDSKTDCYGPTTTNHEFVVDHPPVVQMSALDQAVKSIKLTITTTQHHSTTAHQ